MSDEADQAESGMSSAHDGSAIRPPYWSRFGARPIAGRVTLGRTWGRQVETEIDVDSDSVGGAFAVEYVRDAIVPRRRLENPKGSSFPPPPSPSLPVIVCHLSLSLWVRVVKKFVSKVRANILHLLAYNLFLINSPLSWANLRVRSMSLREFNNYCTCERRETPLFRTAPFLDKPGRIIRSRAPVAIFCMAAVACLCVLIMASAASEDERGVWKIKVRPIKDARC